MTRRQSLRRGFTLIELLVVISILAMLVAMLIPFLQRARDIAVRVQCLSNQRNLAQAGSSFAAAHKGRGPGGGHSVPNQSSVAWQDVLNTEFYKAWTVVRHGCNAVKGRIYCPSMKYWGSLYPRGHMWNGDACGGWDNVHPEGPYGLAVDPKWVNYMYQPYYMDQYSLGALMEKFPRPGYQFLVTESEYGNDTIDARWPYNPVVLNTGRPAWANAADGAFFAFRHVLPRDVSLYQSQATACYAYIDGHAEIVRPTMTINVPDRFSIQP